MPCGIGCEPAVTAGPHFTLRRTGRAATCAPHRLKTSLHSHWEAPADPDTLCLRGTWPGEVPERLGLHSGRCRGHSGNDGVAVGARDTRKAPPNQ